VQHWENVTPDLVGPASVGESQHTWSSTDGLDRSHQLSAVSLALAHPVVCAHRGRPTALACNTHCGIASKHSAGVDDVSISRKAYAIRAKNLDQDCDTNADYGTHVHYTDTCRCARFLTTPMGHGLVFLERISLNVILYGFSESRHSACSVGGSGRSSTCQRLSSRMAGYRCHSP
jgi:hypothetical protein